MSEVLRLEALKRHYSTEPSEPTKVPREVFKRCKELCDKVMNRVKELNSRRLDLKLGITTRFTALTVNAYTKLAAARPLLARITMFAREIGEHFSATVHSILLQKLSEELAYRLLDFTILDDECVRDLIELCAVAWRLAEFYLWTNPLTTRPADVIFSYCSQILRSLATELGAPILKGVDPDRFTRMLENIRWSIETIEQYLEQLRLLE